LRKRILVLFGTRPEAIKLFPVIKRLQAHSTIEVVVCVTAQHREMLDQVLDLANIKPDFDLDLMRSNQSLELLSARILLAVGETLDQVRPDRVVVQGDTATAMIGALAAYYKRIPVGHVEAGLRSGDIYAPWPEEVNRKIVTTIADQHYAPTQRAAEALLSENVPRNRIHVTGNTVVDALLETKKLIEAAPHLINQCSDIIRRQGKRRIILVTTHRRENFGEGMSRIADALLGIAERDDVGIVIPMHLNPNVRDVLSSRLAGQPRIEIISPQKYADFVSLLLHADIVLTDSGGIQEEAPTFGKPVLVMRDTTERPEGVIAGTARLVGTNSYRILNETFRLLDDRDEYLAMSRAHNPFGDGKASDRILKVILDD
jgi:UDP-N-acetylglucosamine 2-epimerase (non-hydrolysing)